VTRETHRLTPKAPRLDRTTAESCLRWRHFDHGADIGIEGVGRTMEEAFSQAGVALMAVITDPRSVRPLLRVEVECRAPDPELLFVDWINALIFEMATRGMLFSRFEVRVAGEVLYGIAWGENLDRSRHDPAVEVKGASYTALRVACDQDNCWHAACVVDV